MIGGRAASGRSGRSPKGRSLRLALDRDRYEKSSQAPISLEVGRPGGPPPILLRQAAPRRCSTIVASLATTHLFASPTLTPPFPSVCLPTASTVKCCAIGMKATGSQPVRLGTSQSLEFKRTCSLTRLRHKAQGVLWLLDSQIILHIN